MTAAEPFQAAFERIFGPTDWDNVPASLPYDGPLPDDPALGGIPAEFADVIAAEEENRAIRSADSALDWLERGGVR